MRWNPQVYCKGVDGGPQDSFIYRWNFLLRALFELLPLMGTVLIWGVVFDQRQEGVGGFDFKSVGAFFLIVLFLDGLVTPKDDEVRIAADIREGQISAFLVKPINYLLYRFSLFASSRLLFSALTLPVFLCLFVFTAGYFSWPSNVGLWLGAVWTTAMAALLQFFISISIALLAFWMLEILTVVFFFFSFGIILM